MEPVESGPVKRVHRANLRPCAGPVPAPRKERVGAPTVTSTHALSEYVPVDTDPEYILLKKVPGPSLGHGVNRERDEVSEDQDIEDTESRDGSEPVDVKSSEPEVETLVPVPRRTLRENAGVHSNPHRVSRSACSTISLSPDGLSYLLTSMGAVFFRETVKGVETMN